MSVFDNTKSKICIHILHDETLSEDNKLKFNKLVERYDNKVIFYPVVIPEELKKLDSLNHITVGSLFRLFIPEKLNTIDKVIYLDGDILVNCNIEELWKIDIYDYCLGAVLDSEKTRMDYINTNYYKKIGFRVSTYFNAGALVINCKRIREEKDLLSNGFYVLRSFKYLAFADQDVLNLLFKENVLLLDGCWNKQINLLEQNVDDISNFDGIVHFSGYLKPWNCYNKVIITRYYEILVRTPWVENYQDICLHMSQISCNCQNKFDLKHSLLNIIKDDKNFIIGVLCFLKMFFNDEHFLLLERMLWKIRQKIYFDYWYDIRKE